MKAYTDMEQSKKLAEMLPIESADMFYNEEPDETYPKDIVDTKYPMVIREGQKHCLEEYGIPCWSLTALIRVLPDEITDDGDVYRNMLFHLKGKYIIQYPRLTTLWPSLLSVEADNPIDACVSMIEELHELKIL